MRDHEIAYEILQLPGLVDAVAAFQGSDVGEDTPAQMGHAGIVRRYVSLGELGGAEFGDMLVLDKVTDLLVAEAAKLDTVFQGEHR